MSSQTNSDTDPEKPVVVLFRHDLRLGDNRALATATESSKPVIALFVFDEISPDIRPIGGARRWWLHQSLTELAKALEKLGATLILRRGETQSVVEDVIDKSGADMVLWNRRYDPPAIEVDKALKSSLNDRDIACASFDGQLLHEPWKLKTGSGGFYKVYTPFWRAFTSEDEPRKTLDAPTKLRGFEGELASDRLDEWKLLPTKPDWSGGLRDAWTPGEAGAQDRLSDFIDEALKDYADKRDRPDRESTSRLSPHLAHGEITPFQIWDAVSGLSDKLGDDVLKFRKELVWREFAWHLLFHNPDLARTNFNRDFDDFPWRRDKQALKAWQKGQTGYPIVDAGMRQLWETGWMHNRVRMVVASFLTKHLLLDWREGEAWFWDTLVDADAANNPASWQWVAGCGADAAPYFRIFNPILQGEKFDPRGDYVRHFVPELTDEDAETIHEPAAKKAKKSASKVKLSGDYPVALIDHREARERALAAYQKLRGAHEHHSD
ncbi:MAG: deoxyribodipyrimidine photo-lyase [Rhizobiaceae bacterium]|nr:deoxyribodipyrimidine photo-lyase [Rhizobiaceae bacterium]